MSNEDEIRTMNLEETWNMFKTMIEMNTKDYVTARFGKRIRFDINDYIKGKITEKRKVGKTIIKGKVYSSEEFETELEERERTMKNYIIKETKTQEVATPRGIEINTGGEE